MAGLRRLAEPGHVPVPEVLGHDDHHLVLAHLPPAAPTATAAEDFGRGLARLHLAGAPAFGTPLFGRGYAGPAVAAAESVLSIRESGIP